MWPNWGVAGEASLGHSGLPAPLVRVSSQGCGAGGAREKTPSDVTESETSGTGAK